MRLTVLSAWTNTLSEKKAHQKDVFEVRVPETYPLSRTCWPKWFDRGGLGRLIVPHYEMREELGA